MLRCSIVEDALGLLVCVGGERGERQRLCVCVGGRGEEEAEVMCV